MHKLIFRSHAIKRMFERGISVADVRSVVDSGMTIQEYPDDQPFPSRLMLGWCGRRPLHVVCAQDIENLTTVVITVYEPDPAIWTAGFERKR